jgi:hypothetical protein
MSMIGVPALRLEDGIETRLVGKRGIRAPAGNGAIDQTRVDLLHCVIVEAEALHDSRREILDKHIRFGDQLAGDRSAGGDAQVERDALLVAV